MICNKFNAKLWNCQRRIISGRKMQYRKYDPEKDKNAVHRIWLETGWIEDVDEPKGMDHLIESGNSIVSDINCEPECLVVSQPGDMIYNEEKIKFYSIAAVTTSLTARKRGLASRLTATRIALDALEGAAVSGLTTFDQGFYNLLGFGTCGYAHLIRFSPSIINVANKHNVPSRIPREEWRNIHQSRRDRMRFHGGCYFDNPEVTQSEIIWDKKNTVYGYKDDTGNVSHSVLLEGLGKEGGPFFFNWMCYQNYDQFLELLGFIKSFGDQVNLVSMVEPPNVQIEDFLTRPFYHRRITAQSKFQNIHSSGAWHQIRINDVIKCMKGTRLNCETIRFNLKLSDPIEKYLDDNIDWRGVAGEYLITLGPESSAQPGQDSKLPTLHASVNSFTRLWMSVQKANYLNIFDDFNAPEDLIKQLDIAVSLPQPQADWDF